MLNIRSNDPENENRSIPSIQEQELIGARLFHQLEISGSVLRQLLLQELCPDREIRRR
jgi:hypothetical protein